MRHETQTWDKIRARVEIISLGVGQTGLTPTVAIRRISDGLYLANGGGSWGAGFATNNMSELSAANLPGEYYYDIPSGRLDITAGASGYLFKIAEATNSVLEYVFVEQTAQIDNAAIADAVWDEATAGHLSGGSTGAALANIATSAQIADAVWDEATAGHAIAASTGKALTDILAGTQPSAIADAVWDDSRTDHVNSGSFGLLMQVMAGLVQYNQRIENPTFDANGRMLTADLVIYPTGTDAQNQTSALTTISLEMTYDSEGNLATLLAKE